MRVRTLDFSLLFLLAPAFLLRAAASFAMFDRSNPVSVATFDDLRLTRFSDAITYSNKHNVSIRKFKHVWVVDDKVLMFTECDEPILCYQRGDWCIHQRPQNLSRGIVFDKALTTMSSLAPALLADIGADRPVQFVFELNCKNLACDVGNLEPKALLNPSEISYFDELYIINLPVLDLSNHDSGYFPSSILGLTGSVSCDTLSSFLRNDFSDSSYIIPGIPGVFQLPVWIRKFSDVGYTGLNANFIKVKESQPETQCAGLLFVYPWGHNIQHYIFDHFPRIAFFFELRAIIAKRYPHCQLRVVIDGSSNNQQLQSDFFGLLNSFKK